MSLAHRSVVRNPEALLLVLQLAVLAAIILAISMDGSFQHNHALMAIVGTGLAANVAGLVAALGGIAPETVGPASTLLNGVLAATAQVATGGAHSPVHPLLTLALASIAIRFRYRRALLFGMTLVAAYVATAAIWSGVAALPPLLPSAGLNCLGLFIFCGLTAQGAVARERFLTVAAHELRNPLAVLRSIAPLLRRRIAAGRPVEGTLRTVGTLEHEVERLCALTDQIVEAFRTQEGRFTVTRGRVDLAHVVAAAVRPFAEFDDTHQVVVVGLDGPPTWIVGDPDRIEQVLRNLLGNAVKYTPGGGPVTVTVRTQGGSVVLAVEDRGIGIPGDQLTKVFEPFFRADNLGGRDPGGLGLGLSICRDIVRRHSGHLWVESEEGVGTAVFVELPLADEPTTSPDTRPA